MVVNKTLLQPSLGRDSPAFKSLISELKTVQKNKILGDFKKTRFSENLPSSNFNTCNLAAQLETISQSKQILTEPPKKPPRKSKKPTQNDENSSKNSIVSEYDQIFRNSGNSGNAPSNPHIDRKSNVIEVNEAFDSLNELIAELDVKDDTVTVEPVSSFPDSEKEQQITDLLQELTSSLAEDGILVKSRGTCKACDQEIMGEIVHALGNCYHPEHFFCAVCQCEIGAGTFIARNDKPYCESCYQSYFSPSCPKCEKPVLNFCTEAMGKKWHPECFVCENCEKCLGDEVFVENKGNPYCEDCYNQKFAPSCKVCELPILERFIFALNSHYHQKCFTCKTCKNPFPKSRFFEYKGDAYCDEHYQAARGFVCNACSEALDGSNYVEALGKKYHVNHFMCAYCFKKLDPNSFKSREDGRHYHHECYRRLFDDYA